MSTTSVLFYRNVRYRAMKKFCSSATTMNIYLQQLKTDVLIHSKNGVIPVSKRKMCQDQARNIITKHGILAYTLSTVPHATSKLHVSKKKTDETENTN